MPYSKSSFSHIYVEKSAFSYPQTGQILRRLSSAQVIEVSNYKNIFHRPRQNFLVQKRNPKLILAVKKEPFLYPASDHCHQFGQYNVFYTTPVLGCPFDCQYCFLKGLYSSANLVVFVNQENFFESAQTALRHRAMPEEPLVLSISYESDILALEKFFGLSAEWIRFTLLNPGLLLEIRTKCASTTVLRELEPSSQVILAWSLSPKSVSRKYEHKAPQLNKRLAAAKSAAHRGWPLRLSFDPVVPVPDWEREYAELIRVTFEEIEPGLVRDITIGPFRLTPTHEQRMRRKNLLGDLRYLPELSLEQIKQFFLKNLSGYLAKNRIYFWDGC